ncbi:glutaredoxin family protein [Metabacillus arenae]|uniref:Glutaredoxin family protein n=1 Tax=Metabacillus arenae TaxID=2771434 RepID=A0A926NFV3_9BACI|nr:glutaredoxin family protein [Metabacillus arenae]MBD1383527.1 glutaredoxin family protein [Metabacillus arenae]
MLKVTLYTKMNCPLCDKAYEAIKEVNKEIDFNLEILDIYEDDHLLEEYQLLIPVIKGNDNLIAYGQISKELLRKRLLETNS